MRKTGGALFFLFSFFSSLSFGASVVVSLKISPAGGFQAQTSAIKGSVSNKDGVVKTLGPVIVDLKSLTTEMKLRDDHMKEKYLEVQKFPTAELIMGEGKNGKGHGRLKIRGVTKDISGTYKIDGKNVEARFEINLSDFDIKGIRYMSAGVKDKAEVVAILPIQQSK